MAYDPITLSVIQAGFNAAADEMFSLLRKTAMSPIIHEVLDMGTGVTDPDGKLLGSGAGIPTFVGVLDKAVQRIIEIHGSNNIEPGDLFVTNDPYYGGVTHLSDVVVAMPVYSENTRIAWVANIAHWSDIGGMVPGSMSTNAVEIIQEGLRLPAVRLFAAGHKIAPLIEIISANSRLPDFTNGDLWAQIAACRRAASRIEKLAATYGCSTCFEAVRQMFNIAEKRSRKGLSKLPKGVFSIQEEQDDGSIWKACISISQNEFVVDLQDNPSRPREPYNTSRDGAVISAQMLFKALADPEIMTNDGSFRPLKVLTRPNTIFHASEPTPHGYYFETRIRLFDMLWRCMSQIMPENLPAGHFASICGTVVAGTHPDTGRKFTMVEPQMGGWGATSIRNGIHCMYSTNHGDTRNCPVEICEARYGIDVRRKEMSSKSSGCGLHNGGLGMYVHYQPRSKIILSAGFSRNKKPVWGANGGQSGSTNRISVTRKDGNEEHYAFVSNLAVEPGESIHIETANGGGWGRIGINCD